MGPRDNAQFRPPGTFMNQSQAIYLWELLEAGPNLGPVVVKCMLNVISWAGAVLLHVVTQSFHLADVNTSLNWRNCMIIAVHK